jgi:hypothetical protein
MDRTDIYNRVSDAYELRAAFESIAERKEDIFAFEDEPVQEGIKKGLGYVKQVLDSDVLLVSTMATVTSIFYDNPEYFGYSCYDAKGVWVDVGIETAFLSLDRVLNKYGYGRWYCEDHDRRLTEDEFMNYEMVPPAVSWSVAEKDGEMAIWTEHANGVVSIDVGPCSITKEEVVKNCIEITGIGPMDNGERAIEELENYGWTPGMPGVHGIWGI